MTDTDSSAPPLAAFRGSVACRRDVSGLTLTGCAADSADDIMIVTFIAAAVPDLPDALSAAAIRARDERHYRIVSGARDWLIEATSVHVHRDIGREFYGAIPPRPVPLKKRFFWRAVLALAGTRAGKQLLLSLRRQA
ncbi:MAG: hypothetical protein ACRETR_08100 [Steroidobacteraceae bacterium]